MKKIKNIALGLWSPNSNELKWKCQEAEWMPAEDRIWVRKRDKQIVHQFADFSIKLLVKNNFPKVFFVATKSATNCKF